MIIRHKKENKKVSKFRTLKLIVLGIFCAFLILSAIAFAAASEKPGKIIFITLNYNNQTLTVKDVSWGKGFVPQFSESLLADNMGFETASLKAYSENRKLVYSSNFYVDNKRFHDFIDKNGMISGGIVELNDADFTVTMPYYKNIGYVKIHSAYNDIRLEHVDIENAKEIKIPSFSNEPDEDIIDSGQENASDSDTGASESTLEKKSFFLRLVGVIDSIYFYIFG